MVSKQATRRAPYRLLIVDDHPIVRRGLRELVADEPDLEVCGEAATLSEALQQLEETRPDIAIIDISLKSGHGLDLIEKIKARDQRVKMLVASMHDESLYAERALRLGASGYINKDELPHKFVDAMRRVLRGEIYASDRVAEMLLQRLHSGQTLQQDPIAGLTNRELEVLEMIGRGLSVKQIAGQLGLSRKTVESHRDRIRIKLNLRDSAELTHHAAQWMMDRA